jgi:hypothetical protein
MTAIYFTSDAEEQATQIDLEWRAHARTNPELFWEQLLWVQRQAAKMRDVYQPYRWVRGEAVRRVYMKRTEHDLYYLHSP